MRGAECLILAVQSACTNTIGKDVFEKVWEKAYSFVTDGANCNTGEKGDLWARVKTLRDYLAGTDEVLSVSY